MVEKEEKVVKKPVFKKTEGKKTITKEALKIKLDDKKPIIKKIIKNEKKETEKKVEIKEVSSKQVKIIKKEPVAKVLDKQERAYATGKRKNAIAKVWIKKGNGKIIINDIPAEEYLKRDILMVTINTPFVTTKTEGKFDVFCQALGGGLSGQAGAIKLGISKALLVVNTEAYRKELKQAGFLTRDPRIVERKKSGLKKARKGQVFSKR